MRIFNKFLKKKIEFELDVYTLKNEDCTPFMLDAKLSVCKNEISIHNSSKKCIFYEENIYDFKYHEIDMCQFKYLCKDVVEEYGFVFSDISGMYNFYKYVMYAYLKGNIILYRNVNLYKYIDSKKVVYKRNYGGVLIFNTDKCEHLLVVIKSNIEEKNKTLVTDNSVEMGIAESESAAKGSEDLTMAINDHQIPIEKREDIGENKKKEKEKEKEKENTEEIELKKEEEEKIAECEKYYKEITIENLRHLYKRNKVFLVYVLNTYNDVFLSSESIAINTKKYLYKNCYKYIEYKGLYSDGESYRHFFVPRENKRNEKEKEKENFLSKLTEKGKDIIKQKSDSEIGNSINPNENTVEVIQNETIKKEKNVKVLKKETNKVFLKNKSNSQNRAKENISSIDSLQNENKNDILKWNEKVLIIFDSESILIDYIQKILIYRYDFKNDILNIKKDYLNTKTTIGFNNEYIDVRDGTDGKSDTKENYTDDEKNSEVFESDSEEEVDKATGDTVDMRYKHVNVAGKYSFVLRQNFLLPKKKNNATQKRSNTKDYEDTNINFDKVKNDLNIYLFDEYGKEKRTYNSDEKLFTYKGENFIPKDLHINDDEGNKLIFLDEKKDTNLFMVDVNTEKIVGKWDTEYVPIEKLLKKEENLYCGYNKCSLYYVDTRMKNCIQNMLQYGCTAPNIEHATVDKDGHILLINSKGELKYFDGELNNSNVIKKCKNSIYCTNNIVHLGTTTDAKYSIATCAKRVIIFDNYVDDKLLFEKVIKVEDRAKQKKIYLQIHNIDIFTYNLGDYEFIQSNITNDNSLIFTFSLNFYVIWNFKEALNDNISYVIKKTTANISDLSLFNVNNIQGVVLAMEDKLTAKKITERTIKQFKVPQN